MQMKIVAGLGSIDDYYEYVKAGADELFIGYVPMDWQLNGGLYTPLNRREVCYYNVQIGSESELEILKSMTEKMPCKITIAINGLCYRQDQYVRIVKIIENCINIGFDSFIIADPGLLLYLNRAGLADKMDIHISGELGELNAYSVKELERLGADRLIFNRKLTTSEMEHLIAEGNNIKEFEAFLLNEKCEFSGAFCNSLHIDEMPPICRMPYGLVKEGCRVEGLIPESVTVLGSGCGLCALWKLREAGVTHLKIVGRGAFSMGMINDIGKVKRAFQILEHAENEQEYKFLMKKELFERGCSGNCYYPEGNK